MTDHRKIRQPGDLIAEQLIDPRRGTIATAAGTGARATPAENILAGPVDALHCALNRPHGVFADRDGAVYIGDTECQRVLLLRP